MAYSGTRSSTRRASTPTWAGPRNPPDPRTIAMRCPAVAGRPLFVMRRLGSCDRRRHPSVDDLWVIVLCRAIRIHVGPSSDNSRVVSAPRIGTSGLSLRFLDGPREGGNDLEEIADDTHVGDAEDRRVGVLVDGDDVPRALHADDVLDG